MYSTLHLGGPKNLNLEMAFSYKAARYISECKSASKTLDKYLEVATVCTFFAFKKKKHENFQWLFQNLIT